jgi:long-chain acyl-CoA synthetase
MRGAWQIEHGVEVMPNVPAARALDTFPRLLMHHAQVRAQRPAIREKDAGIWQTWTWSQVAEEVRALACSLADLGFQRSQNLAIIGDNRPRLYWAMCAAQSLGGVPVPMYQDTTAQELINLLQHAEVTIAIVEDQEQADKLLEIKPQCPKLTHILYDNPRGLRHYNQPFLHGLDEQMRLGRLHDQTHPQIVDDQIAQGKSGDVAIMLYTSGTTGAPKGVMITHQALLDTARNAAKFDDLDEYDEILSYLPMAWVGDHVFSYAQCYVTGFCVNCPESGDTVMIDLREIGPTYYFAPPRIFENTLTQVMIRMEDAGLIKRKMFHYFMGVARRVGIRILDRAPGVTAVDRLLYAVGNVLVYGPLKNVLGLTRVRVGYTAGEAISPELFAFYRSLGINLKQLYGQTEASVFVAMQANGQVKSDTVGPAAPGVEIRIGEDGEVLYRSPGVFHSYFKNQEATAQTKTPDGWVHTGDAGFFDADGHLKIVDRAKDVGRLTDGTLFAPKYIENKLKFHHYIKEAVAFGHQRERVCAFINIDIEAVGNWADRCHLAYSGYTELASLPQVYDLIADCVGQVNRDLAQDEKLANSQIRRFLVLHKALDPDDGELTRTRKVRRGFIAEKYIVLIDALYSAKNSCFIETEVKFEDGRTGKIGAELRIMEAPILFPPPAARQAA